MRVTPRRLSLSAVLMVGLALVLAACGSASKKAAAAAPPTTSTTTARGAALQAFRSCMSSHGVTLPQRQPGTGGTGGAGTNGGTGPNDGAGTTGGAGGSSPTTDAPGTGGGRGFGNFQTPPPGVDPTTYQTALAACRSLIPAAGQANPQFASARRAYAACLGQHGVTVPNDAQGNPNLQGIDRTSPAYQSANQTCQALLPARPGATTTTTAG